MTTISERYTYTRKKKRRKYSRSQVDHMLRLRAEGQKLMCTSAPHPYQRLLDEYKAQFSAGIHPVMLFVLHKGSIKFL